MASRDFRFLPATGGILLALLAVALGGCAAGEDNSPDMGAVPPKPNMNMSAKLPPQIRAQMSQAKPGTDAAAMAKVKSKASAP